MPIKTGITDAGKDQGRVAKIRFLSNAMLFYFFSDLIISPYVFVNISIIYLNKDTLNSFFLYIVIYFLNNLIAIILLLNIERKNIDGAINNIK